MASEPISIARSAAAVSVVKYGLPGPAGRVDSFLPCGLDAPEDVPAPDDEGDLDPQGRHFPDLLGKAPEDPVVDPVRLLPHQGLPRQLQKYASVRRFSDGASAGGIN